MFFAVLWILTGLFSLYVGIRFDYVGLTLAGAAFLGVAFLVYVWIRPSKEERKRTDLEERIKELKEKASLYDEFVKNGVTSCSTPKDQQKATLIAREKGIMFENISTLFEETKRASDELRKAEGELAVEKKKQEEKAQYENMIKYADLIGREKRVTMLTDERQVYQAKVDKQKELQRYMYDVSHVREEECDWGTAGGIASGIAGPAAGVAAAMNAQIQTAQRNAEIRARNARNQQVVAPGMLASMDIERDARKVVEKYDELISEARKKLVAEDSSVECFKRLSFGVGRVKTTETGTCTVEVTASVTPFCIFDNVPAVIDGVVQAMIYDGEKFLGMAEMILPLNGIGKSEQLTGMALFCGKPGCGNTYTVQFAPKHLWAMEQ